MKLYNYTVSFLWGAKTKGERLKHIDLKFRSCTGDLESFLQNQIVMGIRDLNCEQRCLSILSVAGGGHSTEADQTADAGRKTKVMIPWIGATAYHKPVGAQEAEQNWWLQGEMCQHAQSSL